MKYAEGAMKAFKSIKIKPYIKKVFPGESPQMSFPGMEKGVGFDFSLKIPRSTFVKARKHVRKHKFKYEVAASGGAGFIGAGVAHRRYDRKRRKK